jgi:hypothetical protein
LTRAFVFRCRPRTSKTCELDSARRLVRRFTKTCPGTTSLRSPSPYTPLSGRLVRCRLQRAQPLRDHSASDREASSLGSTAFAVAARSTVVACSFINSFRTPRTVTRTRIWATVQGHGGIPPGQDEKTGASG